LRSKKGAKKEQFSKSCRSLFIFHLEKNNMEHLDALTWSAVIAFVISAVTT